MLEPWCEIFALERERDGCAAEVAAIVKTCSAEHGEKLHPVQCSECWPRILNRMRDRYLNSATREWFSGRRQFLMELDTMFSQVHENKIDLGTIEQRIQHEKKEWFRDKVRNVGVVTAAKDPVEAKRLQGMINDKSISAEQLASALRSAFSDGVLRNEAAFEEFLARLKAAGFDQAKAEVYIDVVFQPGRDPRQPTKGQKYIDMIREGTTIADASNTMLRDRQTARSTEDEKRKLRTKLEELRRAKAAHELDKAKKAKLRQDKINAAVAAEAANKLPPCSDCGSPTDSQNFMACPVCLVLTEQYHLPRKPVVFCSRKCHDKSYDRHVKGAHRCASGQHCRKLQDEDTDMGGHDDTTVFCRACIEEMETESLFCSPQCFDMNFQLHTDDVHRKWTGWQEAHEGGIEYASEDKSKYRARRIEDHFVLLDDAFKAYQQRTGASIL